MATHMLSETTFVDWFLSIHPEYRVGPSGVVDSPALSLPLETALWVTYQDERRRVEGAQGRGFQKETLMDYLAAGVAKKALAARQAIVNSLAYDPKYQPLELAQEFLSGVTVNFEPWHARVLLHWIWNVKRRLLGEEFKNELALIFFGPQGGGKTHTLGLFFAPLGELYSSTTLTEVTDDRNHSLLTNLYAACIDEFQGSSKADIEKFKALVSGKERSVRRLYSNSVCKVRPNISFVITTNTHVIDVFSDSTGMRRFVQFEFKKRDALDRAWLNERMDFLGLWRSVDPAGPSPMTEGAARQLLLHQENLRRRDSVEDFFHFHPYRANAAARTAITSLYMQYKNFCMASGVPQMSQNRFTRWVNGRNMFEKLDTRHWACEPDMAEMKPRQM